MTERILLTGIDGFIGGHIAVRLLEAGYLVRGTVLPRGSIRSFMPGMAAAVSDPALLDRMEVIPADLVDEAPWQRAVEDCQAIIHTASPLPIVQPRDRDQIVKPAVEGTLRLLEAAKSAKVRRVVMTSSTVAITEGHGRSRTTPYTEADWTDLNARGLSPYTISKTLAEQAAWEFARQPGAPELVVINPGLTIGPLIFRRMSTSMRVIERIVANVDPAHPRFGYPICDVRDIADMHVRALTVPEAAGERFIGASGFMWYPDMAVFLAKAFPELKIRTRVLPNWIVRALTPFKRRLATVSGILDCPMPVSTAKAEAILGMTFRNMETTLIIAGQHSLRAKARREKRPLPEFPPIDS